MRKMGLRSKIVRNWKPVSSSKRKIENRKNLLNQDFATTGINQKWVTDITYIHTIKGGWCYLSTIQDLHSKKIIAWKFRKRMTTDLVMKTLETAVTYHPENDELILHFDLGAQYTSREYEKRLQELKIKHSFSKKGCPSDNAAIE